MTLVATPKLIRIVEFTHLVGFLKPVQDNLLVHLVHGVEGQVEMSSPHNALVVVDLSDHLVAISDQILRFLTL